MLFRVWLLPGSPNSFEQRTPADVFVSRDEDHTFGASSCSNEAVGRIARIFVRKLCRKGGDLGGDRTNSDILDKQPYRSLYGAIGLDSSACHQGSQFPQCDR